MTANTEEKDIKVAEADKEVSQKGEEAGAAHVDAARILLQKPSRR